MAKALIKWPGGKTGELEKILPLIPKDYDRYVEPFFGGGAVYFALEPEKAVINDISRGLMEFYTLIKNQDRELYEMLSCFEESFSDVQLVAEDVYVPLFDIYKKYSDNSMTEDELLVGVVEIIDNSFDNIMRAFEKPIIKNAEHFKASLVNNVSDKLIRTSKHEKKAPLSDADRIDNFITGFTSGYYMYFRDVYNDICLNRGPLYGGSYEAAVFYFVREYCYGSMFRYNRAGEFNIPYGGISYNRKNMRVKIDNIFNEDIGRLFSQTDIYSQDFENFCKNVKLTEKDFMFLDPPYDTDFSDYEGREFAKRDHERLAGYLTETPAKFLLVIKNTEFIYGLYKDRFNISTFDNRYSYNVKSRNDRSAEHLVITNY
ncbi:MAG: DNA adenine methylase [Lachnospiraceae bacterium]|nr:DNA adenine methylase [Lachnospiraceae bacterium]